MKKLIEKEVNGISIIVAKTNLGKLKIGSATDYDLGVLADFCLDSIKWYGINHDFIHIEAKEDGVKFNMGDGVDTNNELFPFELFGSEEVKLLKSAIS